MSNVVLLGHSFGGQVATCFAARYPEQLCALILCGASIIRPKKYARRLLFGAVAKAGGFIFGLPLLKSVHDAVRVLYLRAIGAHDALEATGIKQKIYQGVIREDLRHLLPKINVPTLLLWGTKDKMTPLRHGKKIARLLPQGKLVVIRNGRHGLHLTHETELLMQIKRFIEE